ncbi:MAG: POTRA domain-containing protein, partial [Myxococcota bacterium]|nr:POTRA domain-containing protein [Myxococcota bacterium]
MGPRGRLIATALALLLLPGAARGGPTTYTGFVVDEIRFDAPASVDADELRYLVELNSGDELRPGDVRRSIDLLYGLGIFREVYVSVVPVGGRLIVTFHLIPSPTVQRITFVGLPRQVPPALLRETLPLRTGDPIFEGDEDTLAEALVAQLAREGFPEAAVSARQQAAGEGRARVTLEVEPGPMYRLTAVEFNAAAGLPRSTLRARVKAAQLENARYQAKGLETAHEQLQTAYRKRGFLEARILPPIVELDEEAAGVTAFFNVAPGPEVSVEFRETDDLGRPEGDRLLPQKGVAARRLRGVIDLDREYRISGGYVQDAVARLTDHYRAQGYYQALVDGALEEEGGRKHLVFRVLPGPQSVLASRRDIQVSGNQVIPDQEVRLMVIERLPRRARRGSPVRRLRVTDAALEAARDDLESRYLGMGYLGAEVELSEVDYSPRGPGRPEPTSVQLHVREGVRTHVRDVEVRGNLRVSSEEVRRIAEPLIGQPLRGPALEESLAELQELYGERGCVDVVIQLDVDLSEDATEATLIWAISEGLQVRYGKV